MSKSPRQDRFANGPFKLIETPIHAQKSSKPYDQYVEAASIMALAHNVIIRGLNSIYRQAPNIRPEEHGDFIAYAKCWFEVLDAHHTMEEETLFPQIEAKTGEAGIMDVNIQQHPGYLDDFHHGLNAYSAYLVSVSSATHTFSGSHLVSLIDRFGPALVTHLSDEIPTLLALSRFGSLLPLLDLVNMESKRSPLALSITGGTPFFFRNLDVEFEGGLWVSWPPMPGLVWWFLQKTFVAWNQAWWRFSSCDETGKMRELPALEN